MPAELKSPVLDDYLGRVRACLPLRRGGDILRELESSIRDRVDDLAATENRAPDDAMVRRALEEIGEPETVADAYAHGSPFLGPQNYRPFLFTTAVVFAVHLALVGVATTLAQPLRIGPMEVAPVGPNGLLSMVASALHALLLDVGLMAFVFAGSGQLRRAARIAPRPLAAEVAPRAAIGRALLAILVALVLNVYRDKVFVVVTGHVTYPLFTEWFAGVLPFVNGVLALSVVSDVLYLVLGEKRLAVAVDALHGVAGLACVLFLLRGDAILAVPTIDQFSQFHEPVNAFLRQLGTLVLGFLALLFAVKTVRRLLRFAQV